MSTLPDQDPHEIPEQYPHDGTPQSPSREDALSHEEVLKAVHSLFPYDLPEPAISEPPPAPGIAEDLPLFQAWSQPEPPPPPTRHPNFLDVLLLTGLALVGLLTAGLLSRSALYFHLWGISTTQKALNDVHYTIGSMAVLYLVTFGLALLIFPLIWQQGLFAGLHWNARAADRRFRTLLGAALLCFLLAMADEALLPGPANAPIDKLFDTRAAAWLLFAFGVTFAPFFEESIFRGFLLPALCTAFDWSVEKAAGIHPMPLDPEGHPQWSLGAMVFASIATSIPFAYMHAEQTAYSLGPFLLLVAVSLVLCWARLATRSLAASVLVHASYNFLLFSLMLIGTGGFRHLDKM
jgi:membrane protease YdiL (CAAX protease family)